MVSNLKRLGSLFNIHKSFLTFMKVDSTMICFTKQIRGMTMKSRACHAEFISASST